MTETAAEAWCGASANCSGFTARSAGGATVSRGPCSKCGLSFSVLALIASALWPGAKATKKIFFKENLHHPMGADPSWVTYVKARGTSHNMDYNPTRWP